MEGTLTLELLFKDTKGASKKVNIRNAQEALDRETVENLVNTLVNSDIFVKDGLDLYATPTGARYVRRTVEDIYMVD
ncbi:DUF2922 domain-containing protein [Fundicoccus culcitae]|uniref:DUF2922 domain-containing protein n=1 Tax=Fundicoccus culcitae TaxID=2969821 RepID=A0ABY5P9G2_9LACT|nr:DUF2922 domain-containing protein [Fundicoccus culcitae]UUX35058.1 DUF2922 domain-containing protein [Fundicoccus culcitae]